MANYVIKEMPAGMGNGKKGRIFPKMQIYTEFDYDKVVELVHANSPAFSKGTIRGVLDTLAVVMKSYLPMGHTMKIDNLGVFSLSLEFADDNPDNQQQVQEAEPKTKYRHVKAKGINFKVDRKLVDEINKENTFRHSPSTPTSVHCATLTNTASSPCKNMPTLTALATVQPPGNSPNLSPIRSQASKPKVPLHTKSGSDVDNTFGFLSPESVILLIFFAVSESLRIFVIK